MDLEQRMNAMEARTAVIEARLRMDDEDRASRRNELDRQLQAIADALEEQAREMARYKGAIGGISLAISILWAGVAFYKDSVREFMK